MTKTELIADLAAYAGITRKQAATVLTRLDENIVSTLYSGNEITLPGIGKFIAVAKPARTGRNPHTGEPVEIAARTAVQFKAAKALKDHLNPV